MEPRLALAAGPVIRANYGIDLIPANTGTTDVLTVGGARSQTVNFSGDHDWFRVSLQAGRTYRFNQNGTPTGLGTIPALFDPSLNLRDSFGSIVASNDDLSSTNRNSQIVFTPAFSGTFYVDAGAYRAYTGGYTVSVSDVTPADDYAAGTGTSGSVLVNAAATTGVVNSSGDRDWFRVYLTAGRNYRIDLASGTLRDPLLRLRNSSGSQLASNDDISYPSNLNSRIYFRPTVSGYYFLDAGAAGTGVGTYTLQVTQV